MEVPESSAAAEATSKTTTGEDVDIAAEIERELANEEAIVPNQGKLSPEPNAADASKQPSNAKSVLDYIP